MLEESIDLWERYLYVKSGLSVKATELSIKIAPRVENFLSEENKLYFLSFSYAEIPLPKEYEVVFNIKNPSDHVITPVIIPFAFITLVPEIELSAIPYGYWTIAILQFPQGIPELIAELPLSDSLSGKRLGKRIGISSYETWQARLKMCKSEE